MGNFSEQVWGSSDERHQRQVDDVLLVEDDDLVDAMRFMFERLKVVEPSGVSALAAVLTHPDRFRGRRVGVILPGGNVGTDRFLSLLEGAQTR